MRAGLVVSALLCSLSLRAQKVVEPFSEKSSTAYKKEIARFQAREAPVRYAKSRDAQRAYKSYVDARNQYLIDAFAGDELMRDWPALARCERIMSQLRLGNPAYGLNGIQYFIARSAEPNARCFGEGTLFINLGLLPLVRTDAELAFIMSHEVAHQLLGHPETAIRERVDRQTSKTFQKEVRSVAADPGAYADRYFTLLRRVSLESGAHSRQAEVEADSLAIILVTNAGYPRAEAAGFIMTLSGSDEIISGSGLYDVPKKLAPPAAGGRAAKSYVGLSGVKVSLKRGKSELDSLRQTHPDAPLRYTKMTGEPAPAATPTGMAVLKANATPETARELVEIIRYFLENEKYTLALHYAFVAQEAGFKDPVFNDIVAASLAALCDADARGKRYEATYVYTSTANDLRALQTALGGLKKADLAALAGSYLRSSPDTTTDSYGYAEALYALAVDRTAPAAVVAGYQKKHPQGRFAPLLQQTAFPKSAP